MRGRERTVVDTNVLIAANRRGTHVDEQCQLRCADAILELRRSGIAVLDDRDLILEEYRRYANVGRQPGVGDMFFKYLSDHRYLPGAGVECATVTPTPDTSRGFDELPVNSLDPSDRKFLAVAVVAGASILNAADSDWNDHSELLAELSVSVKQLCPAYAVRQRVPGRVRESDVREEYEGELVATADCGRVQPPGRDALGLGPSWRTASSKRPRSPSGNSSPLGRSAHSP